MKQVFSALRQVRRELNFLFVVSVVLVLCIEFWWKHKAPIFGWRDAHEGAELAKDFLLSIIASYIFFFIGDHWEQTEHKNRLEPMVLRKTIPIVKSYRALLETVWKAIRSRGLEKTKNLVEFSEMDWGVLYTYEANYAKGHPDADIAVMKDQWRSFLAIAVREARSIIADQNAYDSRMMVDLEELIVQCNEMQAVLDNWPVSGSSEDLEGRAILRFAESTKRVIDAMGNVIERVERFKSEMKGDWNYDMTRIYIMMRLEGTLDTMKAAEQSGTDYHTG